jgi:hypothetical protein
VAQDREVAPADDQEDPLPGRADALEVGEHPEVAGVPGGDQVGAGEDVAHADLEPTDEVRGVACPDLVSPIDPQQVLAQGMAVEVGGTLLVKRGDARLPLPEHMFLGVGTGILLQVAPGVEPDLVEEIVLDLSEREGPLG